MTGENRQHCDEPCGRHANGKDKAYFQPETGRIQKAWGKISRAPLLTIMLLVSMCVIEYTASEFGYRKTWNDSLGYIPERPIKYITHAFLHNDGWHLTSNMALLLFFGWPSEKRWGIPLTAAFIGFSVICSGWAAGQLAGTGKWPTEINPVGFSHAAQTLFVTGTYAAVIGLSNCLIRKFPSIALKGLVQPASRALGLLLATGVCCWSISGQAGWNPDNQTGQVAHAVGALIGGAFVLFTAMTNHDRNEMEQLI